MSSYVAAPPAESVTTLLGAAARRSRLSSTRERALARRIERGDLEAKNELIEAHLRLVVTLVRPYAGRGVPLADLVQEGAIGLIRASEKFDWRRGLRFSTYAAWWIRQAADKVIIETGSFVRLPTDRAREANRLKRLDGELPGRRGNGPSSADLARATGIGKARVAQLLDYRDGRMLRLDAVDESGRALTDVLADPSIVDVVELLVADANAEAIHEGVSYLQGRRPRSSGCVTGLMANASTHARRGGRALLSFARTRAPNRAVGEQPPRQLPAPGRHIGRGLGRCPLPRRWWQPPPHDGVGRYGAPTGRVAAQRKRGS